MAAADSCRPDPADRPQEATTTESVPPITCPACGGQVVPLVHGMPGAGHASPRDDGSLRFFGHDLGSGAGELLGSGLDEYESYTTLDETRVDRLTEILGEDAEVLKAVEEHFGGDAALGSKSWLEERDIELES